MRVTVNGFMRVPAMLLGLLIAISATIGVRPAAAAAADQAPGTVRLMAVGDLSLGWEVGRAIRRGIDPFAHVEAAFAPADLVMGNLECVISTHGTPWPGKTVHLRAPGQAADALVSGGFDLVNVANNHALDFGAAAFRDTLAALDARHIGHVGGGADYDAAHAPLIVERNGLRIAILGYVLPFWSITHFSTRMWAATAAKAGLAIGTPASVAADVAAARRQADVVIVTFHGGVEYHTGPNPAARRFAKAAVDAGAALVIGHHPHVLQGYQAGDHSLIAYSMGNFVFSRFNGRSDDSAILDVTLGVDGVESFDWIPVLIGKRGIPKPATGSDATRILREIPSL